MNTTGQTIYENCLKLLQQGMRFEKQYRTVNAAHVITCRLVESLKLYNKHSDRITRQLLSCIINQNDFSTT